MAKSITMSFSVPVELSIQMEEHMENEKITRSELIKNALSTHLQLKESNRESNKLIFEMHEMITEIKDILKKS